jgi:ligand-binding sensor domain-containing protein
MARRHDGNTAGERVRAVFAVLPSCRPAVALAVALAVLPSCRLAAQVLPASRLWRAPERLLITDLSVVTAVAATRTLVYAATTNGLAVYDRGLRGWRETVGRLDGYPGSAISAMAADPNDDTAWLGGQALWLRYDPFVRRFDGGGLPGFVDQVVLDAADPSRGAYFHTSAGWYVVSRGSLGAVPARDVPPPNRRIGSLTMAQLQSRMPAFDAVRMRIQRDDQLLRDYRLTSAAAAPLTNEVYIGTDGNGAFVVEPLSYATERLPAGLVGAATSAIAAWRGQICAASDARVASVRRGLTCFDDGVVGFMPIEGSSLAPLSGAPVHALLVTERAIWAATDQGLVRAPRRGGRITQLLVRDGLPSDRALSLAPAALGVWVGTSGGLALVTDTGRTLVVTAQAEGPPVLALAPPGEDTLWAGTAAGVIAFALPLGGPVLRPEGPLALRDPVVAIAMRGDTIVAATATRFLVRAGGAWNVVEPPGAPIGEMTRIIADDRAGYWVAGRGGFAHFEPGRPHWSAMNSPGDVPLPVRDIAATRDHVWVATDAGVVRYERRVLLR